MALRLRPRDHRVGDLPRTRKQPLAVAGLGVEWESGYADRDIV